MSKKRYPVRVPRTAAGIRAQESRTGSGRSWWANEWTRRLEAMGLHGRFGRGRNYAASGQVVKATIKLVKGTEGTEELKKEIQDYVKTHTAPYKYPRIVVFRDELPKTVSGKIQRNLL